MTRTFGPDEMRNRRLSILDVSSLMEALFVCKLLAAVNAVFLVALMIKSHIAFSMFSCENICHYPVTLFGLSAKARQ